MPCKDCPREGQPDLPPQLVVGWKAWYSDGSCRVGRSFEDFQALPDDGVIVIMLYYNRFSSDGAVRYRRILQGSDQYWALPGLLDLIYAHSDDPQGDIRLRYPGASIKRGAWTDDASYHAIAAAALADYNVTELGLTPEPGTADT